MNKLIPAVPDTLYHYTCPDHGHPGIFGSGVVKPMSESGLSWFTDLEFVDRAALGLTRVSLNCDRGAIRYRIDDTTNIVPWLAFRRKMEVLPDLVRELEEFPGALPRHWFVAWQPVQATFDTDL